MTALDRRIFLMTAFGAAAAAACAMPLATPADAATLPMMKPPGTEPEEMLADQAAVAVRRNRRGGFRLRIGPRPRRRRRRVCWRNRRGALVCTWR